MENENKPKREYKQPMGIMQEAFAKAGFTPHPKVNINSYDSAKVIGKKTGQAIDNWQNAQKVYNPSKELKEKIKKEISDWERSQSANTTRTIR